jgi:hypothetical protein
MNGALSLTVLAFAHNRIDIAYATESFVLSFKPGETNA